MIKLLNLSFIYNFDFGDQAVDLPFLNSISFWNQVVIYQESFKI